MTHLPPAIGMGSDLPIKVLAVVGAAALGALLLGLLVQLVVKLSFAQRVPPWVLWIIRVLGGVLSGWLVALWLFGVGGGGGGSGGGVWPFGGPGKSDGNLPKDQRKDEKKKGEKEKGKDREKKITPPILPSQELIFEVLGDDDLKKIGGDKFDSLKRYRVPGRPRLLTLAQAKELIFERREAKPALRQLKVVLYRDSPAADKQQVTALVDYAKDLGGKDEEKLNVTFSVHRDQDAPVD